MQFFYPPKIQFFLLRNLYKWAAMSVIDGTLRKNLFRWLCVDKRVEMRFFFIFWATKTEAV